MKSDVEKKEKFPLLFPPHTCLDRLPPPQLMWLFTHCRSLGMSEHSESGKQEEDIALFTIRLKQRAELAEENLSKFKAQLEQLRPLWMKEKTVDPKKTKRKPKPYHTREIENINKLLRYLGKEDGIVNCEPPDTAIAARIYSEIFYKLHKKKSKTAGVVVDINKAKELFMKLCDTINDKYEGYGGGDRPSSPPTWLMDLALRSDTLKTDFLKVVSKK